MSAAEAFIDQRQVRLHVHRLPTTLNRGYAFGGGNDVPFNNVDFFDAPWNILRDDLISFIKGKQYYKTHSRCLVLSAPVFPTLTFTIEPEAPPAEEPKP